MLTAEGLRTILLKVFKLNEEFIVPMDNGWYVPSFDKEKIKTETYIGYRILSKRVLNNGSICCRFRLSFIGKSAEEFCDSLLFWGNDFVVKELFVEQKVKLINAAEELSYPLKDENMTGLLCYFVDFDTESINSNATTLELELAYKIEDYIQEFISDEVALTAKDIENWPATDEIFSTFFMHGKKELLHQETHIPAICTAMKNVKNYKSEFINDEENSENFKIRYVKDKDSVSRLKAIMKVSQKEK